MNRRLALIALALLVATLAALWWLNRPTLPVSQPQVALPSSSALEKRIAAQLGAASSDPTAALDDPVDSGAIAARLATLTRTVTTAALPTDRELADYLANRAERYRQSDYFTFEYRFFSALDHGAATRAVAERQLAELRDDTAIDDTATDDNRAIGVEQSSALAIDQQFGRGFAAELAVLAASREPCGWQGPVSGRGGVYLVCIKEYRAGAMPSLESIRDQLINDWRFEQLSPPAAR